MVYTLNNFFIAENAAKSVGLKVGFPMFVAVFQIPAHFQGYFRVFVVGFQMYVKTMFGSKFFRTKFAEVRSLSNMGKKMMCQILFGCARHSTKDTFKFVTVLGLGTVHSPNMTFFTIGFP